MSCYESSCYNIAFMDIDGMTSIINDM